LYSVGEVNAQRQSCAESLGVTGCVVSLCSLFFFQAEDGIRDSSVTGVQTCALPIYWLFQLQHVVRWSDHS